MKYKLLVVFLLLVSVSLVGCSKKVTDPESPDYIPDEIRNEVKDTGKTIDITDLNGSSVAVKPGDVVYLKLTGESNSDHQWFVTAPTSGSQIRLVDHKVVGLNDPEILDGMFTDEWWIKILEEEEFVLEFDYAVPGQEATDSYSINITQK